MRKPVYKYCSHVKTTQEKRYSEDEDHRQFVRAKRNKHNLPDAWEDKPVIKTKSWKDSRKKQYHIDGRGRKHRFVLFGRDYVKEYKFTNYMEKHNIPHRVENILKTVTKTRYVYTKTKLIGHCPRYQRKYQDGQWVTDYNHQVGYSPIYKTITLAEPIKEEYKTTVVVKTVLVWWSNKNIDITEVIKNGEY